MIDKYVIILLTAHIAGDFYVQTEERRTAKEKTLTGILCNSAMYYLASLVVIIPFISLDMIIAVTLKSGGTISRGIGSLRMRMKIIHFKTLLNCCRRYKQEKCERLWAVSPPMKSREEIKCSRRGTSGGFFCNTNLVERGIFAHKKRAVH